MENLVISLRRSGNGIRDEADAGFQSVPAPYQSHSSGKGVDVHLEGLEVFSIEERLYPKALQFLLDVIRRFPLAIAHIASTVHSRGAKGVEVLSGPLALGY